MLKILPFLVIFLVSLVDPNYAYAKISLVEQLPNPAFANSGQIKFIFTSDSKDFTEEKYTFGAWRPDNTSENYNDAVIIHENIKPSPNKDALEAIIPIRQTPLVKTEGTWTYRLWLGDRFNLRTRSNIINQGPFIVYAPGGAGGSGLPAIRVETTIFRANSDQNVYIVNAQPNQNYIIWFNNDPKFLFSNRFSASQIVSKNTYEDENSATAVINVGPASDTRKTLCMTQSEKILSAFITLTLSCDHRITGINIVAQPPKKEDLPGSVISNQVGVPSASARPFVPGPCQPVAGKEKEGEVCDTALGPIKTNPAQFIQTIFGILLSLAGGIALLLITISGYRLMASQGNPEKVQEAREQLTSAIVGLLFIIFSIAILTIIGVDILRIPGFGV